MNNQSTTFNSNIVDASFANRSKKILFEKCIVFLYVFMMGFVLFDPAVYEYMFPIMFLYCIFFMKIPSTTTIPFMFLYLFFIGGIISFINSDQLYIYDYSVTQRNQVISNGFQSVFLHLSKTIYVIHTFFIFMILFYSNAHKLMPIASKAYLIYAVLVTLVSILGFFHLLPIYEYVVIFGRLMATFKDPNVYVPYMVFPLAYCLHKLFSNNFSTSFMYILSILVLCAGAFLGFSRAGWGQFVFVILFFTILYYFSYKQFLIRRRVLLCAILGSTLLVALIIFLISIDSIGDMFADRAQVTKNYDQGKYGRLERHWDGFLLVMQEPLGYGSLTFRKLYGEDTHNIYLYAFWSHGWLGGIAYLLFIGSTLFYSTKLLFKNFELKPYFLMAFSCFLPHVIEGWIIDTHHWRHVYFIMGMLWAFIALDKSNKLYVK